MSEKKFLFSAVLFSLISLASGQGYGGAVNQTLNPVSLGDVRTFFELLGWPLSGVLIAPLLTVFVFGYFLNEWGEENFWVLLFVNVIVSFGALIVFPLYLLNF